ncbi:MAG: glycosyltransferase family 4 protein [Planctomycetota bacterium]
MPPGRKFRRVLIFAKAYPPNPGGVERYGEDLADAIAAEGLRPYVITQFGGPVGLSRRKHVIVYNVGPGGQLRIFARMLIASRIFLRRRSFDFSYATTWRVVLPSILTAPRLPVGCTIHGREVFMPKGLLASLMRWTLRQTTCVCAVSQFTLDKAVSLGAIARDRVTRNWNGFTPPVGTAIDMRTSDSVVRLLTICRLVPRKNIEGAVRAIAILRREGRLPRVNYVIAGDGESRRAIERVVSDAGLEDVVELCGRISDERKVELYRRSSIFLHPQISLRGGNDAEGFGLVIAEAMAYGLSVVVGADGGAADFVRDGETGRVVDGNVDNLVADAVDDLLADPEKRHDMAERGRAWVTENLSWANHSHLILEKMAAVKAVRNG